VVPHNCTILCYEKHFLPLNEVTVIALSSINIITKDDTINGIFNVTKKKQINKQQTINDSSSAVISRHWHNTDLKGRT